LGYATRIMWGMRQVNVNFRKIATCARHRHHA